MYRKSFFQQLFYTIFLLLLITIVLYFAVTIGIVKKGMNRETLQRQMAMNQMAVNLIPPAGFDEDGGPQKYSETLVKGTQLRMTIIDKTGLVLADTFEDIETMDNHSYRPEVQRALLNGWGSSTRYSSTVSMMMLYTAVYDEGHELVVRLSQSVDHIQDDLDRIYEQILLIFFGVLVLGGILTVIIARRLGSTMSSVKEVAGEFARGNFDVELDVSGSREAISLTRSINVMGRQLQDKISTITYQKNELQGMLNSMREPVILLNHRLEVKEMNPAALAMVEPGDGLSYLGKGILQIMKSVETCELAEKALKSREPQESIIHYTVRDLYLQVNATSLFQDEDNPPTVLLVMNDITNIKKLEVLRKDFVANVSHELKTPVTSIMGYAETLNSGALEYPDKAKEFVEIIFRQTRNLSALIDDLLTLSRLEDGRRRFHKEKIPLCDLLGSAVLVCQQKASDKKSVIEVECNSACLVSAHPVLLEQAVTNLIENAVKYSSDEKTVTVKGYYKDEQICIEVKDQGFGIPEKDMERIFERFYRVDKARSREMGGTGLGLSIVKHIAQIHNGSVTVESREGLGCTFTLSLPGEDPAVTEELPV
ncbi:ATP-binding protein [Oceanispirochaeta sp.]|uniref:HAMP domain-containing sensor histidine kinase n=1 Tax=Oceanispirochaeta sp. TaxID=2035350 RepID=UPI002628849C|nr:ATP-binding protein [Oceanispirochaeta sp.]MDA3957812.1 ATP-binding protein [Oceanispirochaeta sp.]